MCSGHLKSVSVAVVCTVFLLTGLSVPVSADSGEGDQPAVPTSVAVSAESSGSALVTAGHEGFEVSIIVDPKLLDTEKLLDDGEKQYSSAFKGVDLLAKQDDLAFTVVAVLSDISSDHKLTFELGLPKDATLSLSQDGSVVVHAEKEFPIGLFKTPWARDAHGNEVGTYFEINGSTLIQHIEATDPSAYPVVADPEFDAGWVTSTIYFDRFETRLICNLGSEVPGSAVTLGIFGVLSGPVVTAILALAAMMVSTACMAVFRGECLKIKLLGHLVPSFLTYDDSRYCH